MNNIEHIPGPEFDGTIAVNLFGWTELDAEYVGSYGMFRTKHALRGKAQRVPNYSTTWEGMRLVVEEMKRREWEYAIESDGDKVHARFFKPIEGDYAEHNGALDAPFAVAIAAIKAIRGNQYT